MSTRDPTPQPLLGARYRLERRLAQGGMAEVWLATDTALSRQVAVKLLKPQLAADPVVAERFRREAIAVAGLSHPNIVAIYDAVDDGGRQAVVMQYVPGKSLRQLLDEQRRLGPELTAHIGSSVAAALDAAHHAGLVHRDVKPGNILLTPDGRVLLADFGIAKAIGAGAVDVDLTSDHVMMGTAKYLSPEQVRGKKLDGRADLYSLGLVLYECLAGRVPFLGESDADTALARLQRDPTDLGRLRPTLPRALVDLIHRLLARDPARRPRDGAAVRAVLTRVAAGLDDPTGDLPAPRRMAVAVAAGGGGGPIPGQPPSPTPPATARPSPSRRDPTPPSARPRGTPARHHQQRTGRSFAIVAVLLVAALGTAALLLSGVLDGDDPAPAATTIAPSGVPPAGPIAEVVATTVYDPNGDGEENDDQLDRLSDGDPSTTWNTECYDTDDLDGKGGVGILTELSAPSGATVDLSIASAPWEVQVFGAAELPATLDSWGAPAWSDFASSPRQVAAEVPAGSRYVLVMLKRLGPDSGCRGEPYRGRISALTVTPHA
jgi:serine/threonine-protein kinase